jgi:hypothetical protein
MSQAPAPSTGKPYGLARRWRVGGIARATWHPSRAHGALGG